MNRAMGFGIVTGTALSTLVGMPSASAHDITMGSAEGSVTVDSNHHHAVATDSICNGLGVAGHLTMSDGSKKWLDPECESSHSITTSLEIRAMRKCARVPNEPLRCTDWVGT